MDTQLAIGLGVGLGTCVLLICACEARFFCASLEHGQAALRDRSSVKVNYRVEVPSRRKDPGAEPEDGKIHVIWDVDQDTTRVIFNEKAKSSASLKDAPELLGKAASEEEEASQGRMLAPRLSAKQQLISEAQPAFQDLVHVEYFSLTYRCWLPGLLHRNVFRDDDGSPMVTFDVQLNGKWQWRSDVAMDMIRLPFQEDELVEYFSRHHHTWQPGVICGKQPGSATLGGYKVRVEGEEHVLSRRLAQGVNFSNKAHRKHRTLQKVPATSLRRRFPPGSTVEVYRGFGIGWMPAVVENRRGRTRHPDPLTPLSPGSSAGSRRPLPTRKLDTLQHHVCLDPRAGEPYDQTMQNFAERSQEGKQQEPDPLEKVLRPWVMVPIREEELWEEYRRNGEDSPMVASGTPCSRFTADTQHTQGTHLTQGTQGTQGTQVTQGTEATARSNSKGGSDDLHLQMVPSYLLRMRPRRRSPKRRSVPI